MRIFYSVIICLAIVACTTSKTDEKDKVSQLKDEVMEVHDEVMPKMGALMKAKKNLIQKAENEVDSLRKSKLESIASQIEMANESMMVWMRQFDPNFTGSESEMLIYLENQKTGIEKVKTDMLAALLKGEAALARD